MMDAPTVDEHRRLPAWVDKFPELSNDTDPVWIQVADRAKQVVLPAGTEIFREGDRWKQFLFVIEGTVRVYKSFENGRELVLYRVQGGETCCLTTSVLFCDGHYTATAVTEVETRAALVAAPDFHAAFVHSEKFRDFVCAMLGRRVGDFITLLESVTMRQVDVRLARWLLSHCDAAGSVDVSHRELARELGTAREVVSRHLHDFRSRGWVGLGRKNIAIVDARAVGELAYR